MYHVWSPPTFVREVLHLLGRCGYFVLHVHIGEHRGILPFTENCKEVASKATGKPTRGRQEQTANTQHHTRLPRVTWVGCEVQVLALGAEDERIHPGDHVGLLHQVVNHIQALRQLALQPGDEQNTCSRQKRTPLGCNQIS